jgi:hypothetical protein
MAFCTIERFNLQLMLQARSDTSVVACQYNFDDVAQVSSCSYDIIIRDTRTESFYLLLYKFQIVYQLIHSDEN